MTQYLFSNGEITVQRDITLKPSTTHRQSAQSMILIMNSKLKQESTAEAEKDVSAHDANGKVTQVETE